jgi:hypothetical protein
MPFGYEPVEMDRQDVKRRRPRKGIRGGGGKVSSNDTCEIIINTLLCCWILDVLNN